MRNELPSSVYPSEVDEYIMYPSRCYTTIPPIVSFVWLPLPPIVPIRLEEDKN